MGQENKTTEGIITALAQFLNIKYDQNNKSHYYGNCEPCKDGTCNKAHCNNPICRARLKKDNREDVNKFMQQFNDPQLANNIASIVMIVRKDDLEAYKYSDQIYVLRSEELSKRPFFQLGTDENGNGRRLTNKDKFHSQISADALGTGFFVRESVIATSAHVFYPPFHSLDLKDDIRFVRGFQVFDDADHTLGSKIIIPQSNIFKPKLKKDADGKDVLSFYKYALSSRHMDWALIEVESERPTTAKPLISILEMCKSKLQKGDQLYGIGHGLGLPLKISFCGEIKNIADDLFECSLSFFSGNSGSPVFNAKNQVVGILARGESDFEVNDSEQFMIREESFEECQSIYPLLVFLEEYDKMNNIEPIVHSQAN